MSEGGLISGREALALARDRERELVDLLRTLVDAPSPFGTPGERAQAVLAAYLEERGFDVARIVVDPLQWAAHSEFMPPGADTPALNLACRPRGMPAARLLLFGHIDTAERPGAVSGAELRGNRMYGLGVADDKAGVAACAVAVAILRANGGPVPTVLSVHGKGGGARGTLPVIEQVGDVDAALYLHPAETGRGLLDIKCESRGVVDVTLRVSGWTADEVEPGNPETVPLDGRGNAVAASIAVLQRWCQTAPAGCAINVGAVHGGDAPGTTPLTVIARARIVFSEPWSVDRVLTWLDREAVVAVEALPRGLGGRACSAGVTVAGLVANPASTPPDDRWYEAVCSAISAVTGRRPRQYGAHLCSDIRFPMRLLQVPCLGIGPAAGNFHSGREWVDVPDLVRTIAATVLAVCSFEKESSC